MAQASDGADPIRAAITKLFENPKFASIFRPEPNVLNACPTATITNPQAASPQTRRDDSTTSTTTPTSTESGQITPVASTVQQVSASSNKPALLIDVSSPPSSPKPESFHPSQRLSITDSAHQLWEQIGTLPAPSAATSPAATPPTVSPDTISASLTTRMRSSAPTPANLSSHVPTPPAASSSTLVDIGKSPTLEESKKQATIDKLDKEEHEATDSSTTDKSDVTISSLQRLPAITATVPTDQALSSPAVRTDDPVRQLTTRLNQLRLTPESPPALESSASRAIAQKANIKPPPGLPAKPPHPTTVVISERGDLVLVMGEEKQANFIVDSKIISQASSPLKHVINTAQELESLRKHSSGGLVTVRLPEELPDAAKTIFCALHGLPVEGPGMTRDRLYRICILAHEYEITAALRAWWKLWLEQSNAGQWWDIVGTRLIRHLWIAHELGQEKDYCQLWALLVWRSGVDNKGRLLIDGAKLTAGAVGGHGKQAKAMKGMLTAITTARKSLVDKIIDLGNSAELFLRRSRPLPASWKRSTVCQITTAGQEMCDCTMLGGLYRAADLEKWSFAENTVLESPKELYERLLRVKDRSTQVINNRQGPHKDCDPWAGVMGTAEHFRSSIVVCQFSTEKKTYFQAQRKKAGL